MKPVYLCLLVALLPWQTEATPPPNIVLLFSDDAGYTDFGFQGSDIFKTPHLDRLAQRGVVFDQMYVTAAEPGSFPLPEWDGVDLMPHLTGQSADRPHHALFWKKENRGAIRREDWKLIRYPDRPAELYHIPRDPAERHNLAAEHPELVRELFSELFAWEGELRRPLWQLERRFETKAAERMDTYRTHQRDMLR